MLLGYLPHGLALTSGCMSKHSTCSSKILNWVGRIVDQFRWIVASASSRNHRRVANCLRGTRSEVSHAFKHASTQILTVLEQLSFAEALSGTSGLADNRRSNACNVGCGAVAFDRRKVSTHASVCTQRPRGSLHRLDCVVLEVRELVVHASDATKRVVVYSILGGTRGTVVLFNKPVALLGSLVRCWLREHGSLLALSDGSVELVLMVRHHLSWRALNDAGWSTGSAQGGSRREAARASGRSSSCTVGLSCCICSVGLGSAPGRSGRGLLGWECDAMGLSSGLGGRANVSQGYRKVKQNRFRKPNSG